MTHIVHAKVCWLASLYGPCVVCSRLPEDDGDTVCVCDSSLGEASSADTLTISISSTSLLVYQSGSLYSATALAELVQSVLFEHGPASPQETVESYRAVVKVTVRDGELVNQPAAFTTVIINAMNEAPLILLDGQVAIA